MKKWVWILLLSTCAAQSIDYPTSIKNAADYGAVGEGHFSFNAVLTNGSSVVTCSDCGFKTNATVGQLVYATNLTKFGFAYNTVIRLPQGTISSVDSDSQITVSTTANASLNPAFLAWGTDETAALATAWNLAVASCSVLSLPGINPEGTGPAVIMVSAGGLSADVNSCRPTGGSRQGLTIRGQSPSGSYIMPVPSFNPATCTYGSGNACFLGIHNGLTAENFTIFGGGNGLPGSGFNTKQGVEIALLDNSYLRNLQFLFWGAGAGANGLSVGVQITGGNIVLSNVSEDAFGQTGFKQIKGADLGPVMASQVHAWDNAYHNLWVANDGDNPWISLGSFYGGPAGQTNSCDVVVSNTTTAAVYYAIGDHIGLPDSSNAAFAGLCLGRVLTSAGTSFGTGKAFFSNGLIGGAFSGNYAIVMNNLAGNVLHLSGTTVSNYIASSSGLIFIAAGDVLFDDGGNTFGPITGGVLINSSGTVFGSGSITGTALATGGVALTQGWGTSTISSVGAGSDAHRGSFTISVVSASQNPVVTVTLPTTYLQAPYCQVYWAGQVSIGTTTTTTAAFTFNGTPSGTLVGQYQCQ